MISLPFLGILVFVTVVFWALLLLLTSQVWQDRGYLREKAMRGFYVVMVLLATLLWVLIGMWTFCVVCAALE